MTKTKKASTASSATRGAEGAGPEKPNPTSAPEGRTTETNAVTKPPSKQQQLAALVVRDEGATLDQMIAATGWLPHTTRAALTGLKKKGYVISSDKIDGVRTYRAVAPE